MAETEQLTTPQPEVHSVETQDEGSLVDDVIFGGEQGSVSDAFGQPEAPVEPALAAQQEQTVSEEPSVEVPSDNDEVRYQYWQSQADKMRNERDQLQQQFNQIATQQATSQQQQPEPEPEIELPAPPEKPQKPYNFNMDEAMTDSNSESAKYLRQEQSWRDEMDDYKNMQFEYQMAMLQDEREQMQQQRQADIQRQQAAQQEQQQLTEVRTQVMDKFKVDSQVAEDFVRVMSDPSSISLDNLWRLYAADKGLSSPEPQKAAPSGEFQQVKRAQQVPASMGVMPSQNRQTEGSMEDTIMDSMIADYNKQNPWN
tara:strand:+ start:198 stop:1133 length:936 start_codon:yes stop_codon:yes gene_type:complete